MSTRVKTPGDLPEERGGGGWLRSLLRARRLPTVADIVIVLVFAALAAWAVNQISGHLYIREHYAKLREWPGLLLLNFLPPLLIAAGLYLATGRSLVGGLVTLGLCLVIGVVSRIKSGERQEPLLPSDFGLVREALSMAGNYGGSMLAVIVGVILLAVLLCVLVLRVFQPAGLHPAVRISGPLLAAAALVALTFTVYADGDMYERYGTPTGNRMADYGGKGYVYSFFHDISAGLVIVPDDYAADAFEQAGAGTGAAARDEAVLPNIVMIMGEAFSEVTETEGLDYTGHTDPMENFKAIAEDALVYGHLITDVFGGGTVFTEFSSLTGVSPATLSGTTNPYDYTDTEPKDSLAWLLGDLGYYALAIHPHNEWFYTRMYAYEMLGFQEFRYFDSHFAGSRIKGSFVSEEETITGLIDAMEEHEGTEDPLFLFSVTIQNHGPYLGKYSAERLYLFDTELELTEDQALELDNFICGMIDVDRELQRLVDYMEASEEPYVLVYYGDHNPSLSAELYQAIGWSDISADAVDSVDLYTVPFIIWQNSAAAETMDLEERALELGLVDGVEFSPIYLGAALLELLELDYTSPFLQYVNDIRTDFPVLRTGLYRAEGEDYSATLPDSVSELYETYVQWCYYKMFDEEFNRITGGLEQ